MAQSILMAITSPHTVDAPGAGNLYRMFETTHTWRSIVRQILLIFNIIVQLATRISSFAAKTINKHTIIIAAKRRINVLFKWKSLAFSKCSLSLGDALPQPKVNKPTELWAKFFVEANITTHQYKVKIFYLKLVLCVYKNCPFGVIFGVDHLSDYF